MAFNTPPSLVVSHQADLGDPILFTQAMAQPPPRSHLVAVTPPLVEVRADLRSDLLLLSTRIAELESRVTVLEAPSWLAQRWARVSLWIRRIWS